MYHKDFRKYYSTFFISLDVIYFTSRAFFKGKCMKKISLISLILFIDLFFYGFIFASWDYVPVGASLASSIAVDSSGNRSVLGVVWGGVWLTDDAGEQWNPISESIFPDYQVNPWDCQMLDASGDTILLRQWTHALDSWIFYSFDGGENWNQIEEDFAGTGPNLEGDHLVISESNHDRWYYLNDYYFACSDDCGNSWDYHATDGNMSQKSGLFLDSYNDSTIYYTGNYSYRDGYNSYGGLSRSTDNGETWISLIDFHDLYGFEWAYVYYMQQLSNGDLIALVGGVGPGDSWWEGNVLVSSDDGSTWNRIYGGLPINFLPYRLLEAHDEPGTLFIIGKRYHRLYKSEDYGRTWQVCLNGLPTNYSYYERIYQNSYSGTIYVTIQNQGIYSTNDLGESWFAYTLPPIGSLGMLTISEETVFFRDDGYNLWRMDENENYWNNLEIPLPEDTVSVLWHMIYQSSDTLVCGIRKWNYTGDVDWFQMTYSYDDGETWHENPPLDFIPYDHLNIDAAISGDSVTFLSLDGRARNLFISYDIGISWDQMEIPESNRIFNFKQNDALLYVLTDNGIYYSTNDGDTWIDTRYDGTAINANCSPTLIGNDLYIISEHYCYQYDYADNNWQRRGLLDDFTTRITSIELDNDSLLIGIGDYSNNIWLSDDFGTTFIGVNTEFPYERQNYGLKNVWCDPGRDRIWISAGIGICYIDYSELDVKNSYIKLKFPDYDLVEIYPNPFNDEIILNFSLKTDSEVRVEIYDINGRTVKTIVTEEKLSGQNKLGINLHSLPSGTYLVILKTPERNFTSKVVKIK